MISGGVLQFTATRLAASASRDQIGLRTDTWSAGKSFRVDMRSDSANEQQRADGITVRRAYELRARWQDIARVGLSEVDRISCRGKTLRIGAIRNLGERDRVAVISAEEVD